MSRVFVTIQHGNTRKDLAMPGDIPSQFLAQTLAKALDTSLLPGQICYLETISGNVVNRISPARSLEEARVVNGSFIRLSVENTPLNHTAILAAPNGVVFVLNKPVMLVGRPTSKNDVPVDVDLSPLDKKKVVSRKHAVIRQEGENLILIDIQSRNGTWINETRLTPEKPYRLNYDDRIYFGNPSEGISLILSKG
jgi:hypothetical protein